MTRRIDPQDLELESYNFELPPERIAERPAQGRHHSKLLVYDQASDSITDTSFLELHKFLPQDSLLVLNQSKVFPCRLLGEKTSGGKVELFILSLISQDGLYQSFLKSSGKKKVGDRYHFGDLSAEIIKAQAGSFWVRFNCTDQALLEVLEKQGRIPIPPYIRGGESDERDKEDYQTIYANQVGSVAAPTAGLHFTEQVFENLDQKNIQRAFVTLHVGAGTFAPVKSDNILEHQMHSEFYSIDRANLEKIQDKAGNIFAVGTTSLRTLESAYQKDKKQVDLAPDQWFETDIFLHPGVPVHSIAGLITNFHLPKSTLIMLVSSLIGRKKTLELYQHAIEQGYRFFSYGDAMLIIRNQLTSPV
jgi:S-adenosylmethionine:tRNA ribosyltransferase-isomerase